MLVNVFNDKGTCTCTGHVYNGHQANKCRQSFYSPSPVGILYPGESTNAHSYLKIKHIYQPGQTAKLKYNME